MLPRSWANLRSQSLLNHDRYLVPWMCLAIDAQRQSSFCRLKQPRSPHLSHKSAWNSNKDTSSRDESWIRPQRLQIPKGKEAGMEASFSQGRSFTPWSHFSGDDLQSKAKIERSLSPLPLILRLITRGEDRPHHSKATKRGTIWFQLRRDPWQRTFTPQTHPELGQVLLIYMIHSIRHSPHFISFLNYHIMVLPSPRRSASSCCRTGEAARVSPSGSSTTTKTKRWGFNLKFTGW